MNDNKNYGIIIDEDCKTTIDLFGNKKYATILLVIEMKTIEQVDKFSHEKFQKTFGVNRFTFATMLSILNIQYEEAHKKGGRPPKGSMFGSVKSFV